MAPPVRVRRLTSQERQKLQQLVRRGSTSSTFQCARHPGRLRAPPLRAGRKKIRPPGGQPAASPIAFSSRENDTTAAADPATTADGSGTDTMAGTAR